METLAVLSTLHNTAPVYHVELTLQMYQQLSWSWNVKLNFFSIRTHVLNTRSYLVGLIIETSVL